MSPKLTLIARKMQRQTQAPAQAPVETSGLGATLESLIEKIVQARVEAALQEQRQQPARVRDLFNAPEPYTDYRQLPPVPRTQPPKAMDVTFQRDELRRIAVVNLGNEQWRVQRGAHGEIVRMIPVDQAPMPPAIEPPELKQARQYDPGTERL